MILFSVAKSFVFVFNFFSQIIYLTFLIWVRILH